MDELWLLSVDGQACFKLHIDVAEPIVPKTRATLATISSNPRPENLTRIMLQVNMRGDVLDRIVEFLVTLASGKLKCPSDTQLWKEAFLADMSGELLNDVLQEVAARNKTTGEFHTHYRMEVLELWLSNEARRTRAIRRKPGRIQLMRLWLAETTAKYLNQHIRGCFIPR